MSEDGEGVHDPVEAAVVADDDVGVLVEGEEGRKSGDAIATLRRMSSRLLGVDVVTEGELGEVAAIEGEQEAAEESAQDDAAVALIGGEIVGLALGEVELLLMGFDVDVGVGHLAEVDFRAA